MEATRGAKSRGDKIKSIVRLFSQPGDADGIRGWDTAYIRDTCNIRWEGEASKYLGGVLGTQAQIGDNFTSATSKAGKLHDAIGEVDDPATQIVLRCSCADVSKVVYQLRLSGDKMTDAELEGLGKNQRTGTAQTLGGDIGDLAWAQATAGRKKAGLGLRPATEVALSTFIASRTASRCGAAQLFKRLEEAGLATEEGLLEVYDQRTADAVQRLEYSYQDQPTLVQEFRITLEKGSETSSQWWDAALASDAGAEPQRERGGRPGAGLLPSPSDDEAMSEDIGADSTRDLKHANGIQKQLTRAIDKVKLAALTMRYEEEGSEEDVRRLRDLGDEKNPDFSWWGRLNPEVDRVL